MNVGGTGVAVVVGNGSVGMAATTVAVLISGTGGEAAGPEAGTPPSPAVVVGVRVGVGVRVTVQKGVTGIACHTTSSISSPPLLAWLPPLMAGTVPRLQYAPNRSGERASKAIGRKRFKLFSW